MSIALLLALAPAPVQELPDRPVVVAGKRGKQLDDYLTRCAAFGFSGVALVEVEGKLVLRKGYGLADAESGAPNTPETLYDIASASKQLTAAAILKLEEAGKLSTEDSIAKYLPGVPEADEVVTIDHLLMHTSGFSRYGPSGGGTELEGAVRGYTSRGRNAEPGARHEYWNGGYALLAGIVEVVTGEPFEDWVRDELFAPAGLLHTDFIETVRVDEAHLARTHDDGGKLTTDYLKGWGYKGMGGMLTSVSDLHLWVDAVLSSDVVLGKEARAKLLEPGLGNYARGWYVLETDHGTRCVQHGGTAPGFQSYIRSFLDDETLVLVMCNREGMHWQVAWGLEAIVYGTKPKVPEPPAAKALPKKDAEAFIGTWESPDAARLIVEAEGASFVVHAQGTVAIAALSGETRADADAHKWERETALLIMQELAEGEVGTFQEVVQPQIMAGWPARMRDHIWPDHLEEWGALEGMHELGAFEARDGVRVWIGLDHEGGQRAARIVFKDRKLGILSLKAGRYPLTRFYAPASKARLETYTFSNEEGPAIELTKGRGRKPATLRVGTNKTKFARLP